MAGMPGRSARVALLCTLAIALPSPGAVLQDDRGVTVRQDAPASRIVTLAPHLAEIVFAAGAGARLVGVARHSDYPPQAAGIPQIGDAARQGSGIGSRAEDNTREMLESLLGSLGLRTVTVRFEPAA